IAQIVIALDILIPQPRITRGVRTDGEKLQPAETIDALGDLALWIGGRSINPTLPYLASR
ncbi:MAG TPA: hypothetical protein VMV40_05220, partial [Acidiferrobacter sp.]|nr:hypothetical protein [Acidiferrobacter sp.]